MKYQTDRKWAFFGSTSLIILLVILWTSPNAYNYLPTSIAITSFFTFVALWSFFGRYLLIEKEDVCFVNYFFIKKCFKINDIDSVYYQPSWSIGESARSLNIINLSSGQQEHIGLPNVGYSENTLATIAKHLKELNPSIQLDEHTETLITKYIHA